MGKVRVVVYLDEDAYNDLLNHEQKISSALNRFAINWRDAGCPPIHSFGMSNTGNSVAACPSNDDEDPAPLRDIVKDAIVKSGINYQKIMHQKYIEDNELTPVLNIVNERTNASRKAVNDLMLDILGIRRQ